MNHLYGKKKEKKLLQRKKNCRFKPCSQSFSIYEREGGGGVFGQKI